MLAAKLQLQFDPIALKADLASLRASEWAPHFNTRYFEGDWSHAALRAPADASAPQADAAQHVFVDTPLLAACPNLRAVLDRFTCPLRGVRLLRLAAGSSIREHQDYDLGEDLGELRIHVPITTHPAVEFFVEGRRFTLAEGECWYLDLARPHWVNNRSPIDRVHLVLDCKLDDWLAAQLALATPCAGEVGEFEHFRARVLADPAIAESLVGLEREVFIARTVELGQALGFGFLASDVDAALNAARRAWTAIP